MTFLEISPHGDSGQLAPSHWLGLRGEGGSWVGRAGNLPEASRDHRNHGWGAPPGSAVSLVYRYKTEAPRGEVPCLRPHVEPEKVWGPEVRSPVSLPSILSRIAEA